ncbi:molybdopterin-binding protein [Oxalobacteraceae bacterium R-40]|uniref:Molybdopterin-binding protein n=1 Tax=Keguizhuia sedimenti TaxID=3064264 RepID=A0ABU1BU92_9BURK|nr:molybdopterin-binding protein [Oxalobacteraceae bacterium R-40]
MAIGLLIIGDEILSGKRADRHLAKLIELLSTRGMQLSWAEYIGDDPARITATLQRSFASRDIVFSCGGIGATPDDHTRRCAAAALGLPLVLHPGAKEKIQERIADMARTEGKEPQLDAPENLHRLKMGEFPQGAQLIPNPYNKIPGFSIAHPEEGAHYFLPGFPVMAGPMMEWVLDTIYPHLFHKSTNIEKSVFTLNAMESALTPLMEQIEAEFGLVKVFSLPHVGDARTEAHIELGVKGDSIQVESAFQTLLSGLDARHVRYRMSL